MANGKFVYNSGASTYVFADNYVYGYLAERHQFTDRGRAVDGTMRTYLGGSKKSWVLIFRHIGTAQKDALEAIFNLQVDLDFYADADGAKTMTCQWANPFNFRQTSPGLWSGTIHLEEI